MLEFRLTDEQLIKVAEWDHPETGHKCKEGIRIEKYSEGKMYKYSGPIGGHIAYEFTPNSIGVSISAKCEFCGEKLDLTGYDMW